MGTIGLVLTKILSKPEETTNRTVYISSFEPSMNDLLVAYKEAIGVADWKIEHDDVDKGIRDAQAASQASESFMKKMRAFALLRLLVGLKKGLGGDFVISGISDNELLRLPRESVKDCVKAHIPPNSSL